jgi:alpha-glucosidase
VDKGKLFFIKLFLLALLIPGLAQVQDAGRILSYKKVNGGIEGKTQYSIFSVHAYSDHIIRVRISKNKIFNDFSYALVSSEIPLFDPIISDKGKWIELSTPVITVMIEKEPFLRIVFQTKTGDIINEDMAGKGFGTTFIGNKVSSYKKLQEGERFVGLGEVLGNLDKRGMGFTLNNTDTYKYGDPRLSKYSILYRHSSPTGLWFIL